MMRHVLLVALGLAHAIVAWAVAFAAAAFVLDRYTSDTVFGTFVQIVPFLIIAVLIVAYPAYLATKKRFADAAIVFASAVVSLLAVGYTVFGLTTCREDGCGSDVDVLDPCLSATRDAMSDAEKLACPNWCPYRGPLLGGNYWTEGGERCVYL